MTERRSLPHRIRRAFRLDLGRRRSIEAELDEEVQFHLEQRVRDLIAAGRTREQAEREALERFGPFDESRALLLEAAQNREEVLTMFERLFTLQQDAAYALRQLRRAPAFTITALLTFALGIGANATMFGLVDQLLLRPPAHVRHPEQVVSLAAGRVERGFNQKTFNYPAFKGIRDHVRGLESVAATAGVSVPLGRGEQAQNIRGLLVSASYFPMLGVMPAAGRFFRADEDVEPLGAPVVVISHGFWMRQFSGNDRALGAQLQLGDRLYSVVGVAPKNFRGLELVGPDVWIPITSTNALQPAGSGWATNDYGSWLRIFARAKPDVPLQAVSDDALRVVHESAPNAFFARPKWSFSFDPIMSTRAADQGANATVTTLLGAMSIVVLLIACANVANLLLARGLRRRREIAVRLALGVSRARLVGQLLTESALLAVFGGIAALFVAYWAGGIVRALLLGDIALELSPVDGRVLLFTAVTAVLTGALTGVLPALQVSRPDLTSALKAGERDGGGHRSRTRTVLLIVQSALCLVLLAGAGLFVRSLGQLAAMPLGVDVDRVLIGSMNLRSVGRQRSEADVIFDRALEQVRRVPGVTEAAVAATVPFGQSFGTDLVIAGPDSLVHGSSMLNVVTPGYFRTLGARVLSGRDFQTSDGEASPRVAIISDILARRYWKGVTPVGRCIRLGADTSPCMEIVGVVENVRRQSIFEDSSGFVYLALAQARTQVGSRQLVARVNVTDPTRAIESVRRAMQMAAAQLPFADVHLVADEPTVRQQLRPFRLGATMFGIFGSVALLLAAVGVYGVVAYDVAQRTREMGLRIALGAPRADVAKLVIRDGVRVVAMGAGGGILIALAAARFIAPLLYKIPARDPLVLFVVSGTLVLSAVAACAVPAWRATRVDAVVALRSE